MPQIYKLSVYQFVKKDDGKKDKLLYFCMQYARKNYL